MTGKQRGVYRPIVALCVLGTLGAIAWYAYWTLPQRLLYPGFTTFFLLFFGGLSLPYLLTLVLLAWRGGRNGLRLAFGASLVNAIWALPLGALLVLFGGFTMGNRDQIQSLMAVAFGALLQLPLLIFSGIALWQGRKALPRPGLPPAAVWICAILLPVIASGGSFLYADRQFKSFQTRSTRATHNSRVAQETLQALQQCLATYGAAGYPAQLDACADLAPQLGTGSGYHFLYRPALPDPEGRSGAYLLCAQPLEFRATGFDTVVADSSGRFGAGVTIEATVDNPPTCASVLAGERLIAWCAYDYAALNPDRGYPARLEEIAACLRENPRITNLDRDRLSDAGATFAYLSAQPAAGGRIDGFRIYRQGISDGGPLWIDAQLRPSTKLSERSGPTVDGLPALAAPEPYLAGCAAGRGDDCFLAGYEWQRKARQIAGGETDPAQVAMRQSAMAAFTRGCDLGEARSCTLLASELETGNGPDRDVVRAASLYEKACAHNNPLGCRNAAGMYENGRKAHVATLQSPSPPPGSGPDLVRDLPRAIALYDRACELGDQDACFIAGRLLTSGEGIAADSERALAFFARICDDGMPLACLRAADLAPERAEEFRHRACVLGEPSACR